MFGRGATRVKGFPFHGMKKKKQREKEKHKLTQLNDDVMKVNNRTK